MGQFLGIMAEPLQNCSMAGILEATIKRKRCFSAITTQDESKSDEYNLPKKKKLLTTTQYIYQALYKDEKSSDIAVMVLGRVWHLHKVYLCQSPYFYSMFNGSWKESGEDFVHIKILDERITIESLDAVFGSLYSDEIEINHLAAVSILASATLFHLESIIEKCGETMIEHINTKNVVEFYEAACLYGCINVKRATFDWLEKNLLSIYIKHHDLLRQLNIDIMTKLVSSPDLYVMQTEFSLYTMLRTWIFLRLNPDYVLEPANSISSQNKKKEINEMNFFKNDPSYLTTGEVAPIEVIQAFFSNRTDKRSFLTTPDGLQFVKPFQALRTQYVTNHHMDLKIILHDNIIPKEWINSHVLSHWSSILKVDHLPEEGPQNLDPDEFFQNCMRCGRVLFEPGYQKWRWTGFNFGLDLIIISDGRLLTIRRHHRNEHERLLSLQVKRQFMIRTCITSFNNENRQPIYTQKSEVQSLCLEKNEEVTLMVLDSNLKHPLLISVNLLVVPPTNQNFKVELLSSDETNAIPISEIGANCDRSTTPTTNDSPVCVELPNNLLAREASGRSALYGGIVERGGGDDRGGGGDNGVCAGVIDGVNANANGYILGRRSSTQRSSSTASTRSTCSNISIAGSQSSSSSSSASFMFL